MAKKIVICVQQRYAPNPTCCANSGSMELVRLLTEEISRHNLPLEIETSGCMGMCCIGPNAKLMPDGRVWNQIQQAHIQEILACACACE